MAEHLIWNAVGGFAAQAGATTNTPAASG